MSKKTAILISFLCLFSFLQAQISEELIEEAEQSGLINSITTKNLKNLPSTSQEEKSQVSRAVTDQVLNNETVGKGNNIQNERRNDIDISNTIFGRETFSNKNLSFSPDFNIPTPKDYRLAAGDELLINVWGDSEMNINRTISPEGRIIIPGIGPISLSGLTVEAAENKIRNELSRIMSTIRDGGNANTFVSVSLGKIRSIQVNIVGEALNPGTYTLPSFATLFNALYSAGGVNNIGSLRNVRLFRNNKQITSFDVYNFLLNGKYDSNIRLENNDMIIIGPYEQLITISGHVKRNRIFELMEGESLEKLLDFAGGFTGDAYSDEVKIKRKSGDRFRIFTVNPNEYDTFIMHDGDSVVVDGIVNFYENRLTISGAIWRPGEYELTDETNTIKKLISKAKGLKGDELSERASLIRLNKDFTTTMIAIDLMGIMENKVPDLPLQNEDKLIIHSIFDLREPYSIKVQGAVNNPGIFPYSKNITIEDAIIKAGGLKEAASAINIEVARRIKNPHSSYTSSTIAERFSFNLTEDFQIRQGDEVFTLKPFDEVYVRYSPEYSRQHVVHVHGEVIFAGEYALSEKNTRLSDIIALAGGVTSDAYIRGANLKRKTTPEELNRIATFLKLSLNSSDKDSIPFSSSGLEEYSVGIDLEKALKNRKSSSDLVLRDGDELYIPQIQTTVKVSGAVNYPNTVTYTDKMSVKDVLSNAGGYNENARKNPIVIYMNGMVGTTKKKVIFFKKYPKLEPGCEIIIPSKTFTDRKLSTLEIMSIASSTTSMAAMVTSLINNLNK